MTSFIMNCLEIFAKNIHSVIIKKIQFDTIFMYFNSPYSAVANRIETKTESYLTPSKNIFFIHYY